MSKSLLTRTILKILKLMPPFLVRPIAFNYIAGDKLEDVIPKIKKFNEQGIKCTVDILGESASTREEVARYLQEYKKAIDAISENKFQSGISIKLTAFGMSFDESLAKTTVRELVEFASEKNIFVRIDMEDSTYTDKTLDLYRELKKDFPRVGVVLQACLKRTENDINTFEEADFRLCKGIYVESPAISFREYGRINSSYLSCLEQILSKKFKVGIATHDYPLLDAAKKLIKKYDVPKKQYEFQMLYGVRTHIPPQLVNEGHSIRVYLPYGKDWYPYSMRRLAENPAIIKHVIKSFFSLPCKFFS